MAEDRMVKRDEYRGFRISTVKLPFDHMGDWYETVVFGDDSNDLFMSRCETEEEAIVQHAEAICWVNENYDEISMKSNHYVK